MAERSVVVRLRAEVADFKRQMNEAALAVDKLPQSVKRADTELGRMVQSARYVRESWDRAGTTMLAFGTATIGGLALSARAAVNWESQWTGVLKTVDGTSTQLAGLEDDLREMARSLPATHQEIAAVAEAAGALGVATEDVASFTRVMIDLGETTNLTADEAATSIAQLMNVMQTAPEDVDNLASALVDLGNNGASTERQIILMAQRIAAAGEVAGFSEADVLGLANALASVGIEAEAGGSAISRVIVDISSDVAEGGDALETWARVAGMTADDFARAWREDPAEALAAFTSGLGRMRDTGQDVFGVLAELGMSDVRVRNALLTMATSGDLLTESLQRGAQAWDANNALAIEAAKRYDTAAASLDVAKNSINDAAISLGETFLPAVADAAQGVADFAGWIAQLPAPVLEAGGRIGAMAGVTALAAGAFLTLFPRIVETVTAFKKLPPAVQGGMRTMGRIGGAATAATIGFTALTAGVEAYADANAKAVTSTEEALQAILDMEAATDLDDIFAGLGYGVDEVESLEGAIRRLASPDLQDRMQDFGGTVRGIFGAGTTGRTRIEDQFEAIGEALASMVSTGNAREAARQFDIIASAWEAQGGNLEDLNDLMPAYTDALAAAENQTELAGTATQRAAADAQFLAQATEEATQALEEWRQMAGDADSAFLDLTAGYQSVIDKNREVAQSTADATSSSEDSWDDYYDGVSVSAADYIASLQAQVDAQTNWETNMLTVAQRVREGMTGEMRTAGEQMIDELLEAGPEGAAAVALIASMSETEFAQVVTLWGEKGAAAVEEFVTSVETYRQPQVDVTANLTPAENITREWMNRGREISVGVKFYQSAPGLTPTVVYGGGHADGGPIPGPYVGSTADNVLIRATPREYMQPVDAHDYWGTSFMDAVRRRDVAGVISRLPGYAGGGSIGGVGAAGFGGGLPGASSVTYEYRVEFTGPIVAADPQAAMRAGREEMSWALRGLTK